MGPSRAARRKAEAQSGYTGAFMAVYVDPVFHAVGPHGWTEWCHMTADTLDELHAMADRLGMRREWFQGRKRPHYDLTPEGRAQAVSLGATEISTREMVRRLRRRAC